jgi:hypothetical protein
MEIYQILSVYLIISIIIIFLYFRYNLHLNEKYKFLIEVCTAIFGFLTIFVLLLQSNYNTSDAKNQESIIYNDILTNIFTNTMDNFMNNPDIYYFYDEIFNGKKPNQAERKPIMEEILCNQFLSACGNYSAYYYSHINIDTISTILKKHNKRILKIINFFMNAPTFDNYLIKYITNIAGDDFIDYMNEFFMDYMKEKFPEQ